MNFQEYYEKRQSNLIGEMVDNLLIELFDKDVDFNEFWKETALPVLCNSQFNNEEELLTKITENWWQNAKQFAGGMKNKVGDWLQGMSPEERQMMQQMNQTRQGHVDQQQSQFDQQYADKKRQMDMQAQQAIMPIKQAFATLDGAFKQSLQNYVQAAQQSAQQSQNPAAAEIAQQLAQQMSQYHKQSADNLIQQRIAQVMKQYDPGQAQKAQMSPSQFMQQHVQMNQPNSMGNNSPGTMPMHNAATA